MTRRGRWNEERHQLQKALVDESCYGSPRETAERRLKEIEAYMRIAKAGSIPKEEWPWLEGELSDIKRIVKGHDRYQENSRTEQQLKDDLAKTKNAIEQLRNIGLTDWQARVLFLSDAAKYENHTSAERHEYWRGQETRYYELMDELDWLYWQATETLEKMDKGVLPAIFEAMSKNLAPNAKPHLWEIAEYIVCYWIHGLRREPKLSRSEKNPLVNFTIAVYEHFLFDEEFEGDPREKIYKQLLKTRKRCQGMHRPFKYTVRELYREKQESD